VLMTVGCAVIAVLLLKRGAFPVRAAAAGAAATGVYGASRGRRGRAPRDGAAADDGDGLAACCA